MHKHGVAFRPQDNIKVITPIVPFRQFNGDYLTISFLKRALAAYVKGADKIIVTHPFWGQMVFDELSVKRFDLYDITEDFTRVQGILNKDRLQIEKNDDYLTRKSKAVVCVSQGLQNIKSRQHGNIHLIPNGVDIERLNAGARNMDLHIRLSIGLKKKILLYAGGINNRFDFDLVTEILKAKPEWSLVMVGSYDKREEKIRSLKASKNCFFTSQVSLEDVGKIIAAVDVCIIPHIVNELTRSQSTQKIYDFMAMGKPIVASDVIPEEMKIPGVWVANGIDGWIKSINKALNIPETQRAGLVKYAKDNDWDTRFIEYSNLLNT
ncbi:MAG: glycosyltransferase [Desulfocucumaceae bacterium]